MSHISRADRLMASAAFTSLGERPAPRAVLGRPRADAMPSLADIKALIDGVQKGFHDFKEANDQQIAAALKGKADVVVAEKVDRINDHVTRLQATIDEVNTRLAAIAAGAGTAPGSTLSPEDRAYAADFDSYVRSGDPASDSKLRAGQKQGIRAAMSVGSSPDGGYLAPVEWDRTITDRLKVISPMRQVATVQTITTAGYIKVFNDRAVGSGWVGETAARPQTSNPQFATLTYAPGEIYANPAVSQQLLDDAVVDIGDWLAGEVEMEFSRQEGIAFITGDGTNKPKGILTYTAGGSHPWGAVQQVAIANAAAFDTDDLVDLVYSLDPAYADNARWLMNRATQGVVRKFKDSNNNYIWNPSIVAGQPASLLGYPVTDMGAMPNIAATNRPIVFGDVKRAYIVIDRMGVRLLRDPFSNKPYIMFYTTKRVGGGLLDPDAIRYLFVTA